MTGWWLKGMENVRDRLEHREQLFAGARRGERQEIFRPGSPMIGLTHMLNNDVADSSSDPRGAEWWD